jgi:hypothetical protein
MPVHVTIDVGSKDEAELIAAALPGEPQATSRRGYGVIRLRLRNKQEIDPLLPILADCVKRHRLSWARLRFGDEERMFRTSRARAS